MTQFWIIAALLVILAAAILLWPTLRRRKSGAQRSWVGILVALATPVLAIGIYAAVTNWDPEAANRSAADWAAIGRERARAGDYYGARVAYIAAFERTPVPSNALKLALAESLIMTDPESLLGEAGFLVEQVLAAEPNNTAALFYGAMAAGQRGELANARERFSRLLAAGLPRDIEDIVRAQLAAIAAAEAGGDAAQPTQPGESAGKVVRVRVTLGEGRSLPADLGPQARLYVFARRQDSPAPVAVKFFSPSAIPVEVTLSDAESPMAGVAGAQLSSLSEVSLEATLSSNGDARGQAGDLQAGPVMATVGSDDVVELVLDHVKTD